MKQTRAWESFCPSNRSLGDRAQRVCFSILSVVSSVAKASWLHTNASSLAVSPSPGLWLSWHVRVLVDILAEPRPSKGGLQEYIQ